MKRLSIVAALIAVPVLAGCNSTTSVTSTSTSSTSTSSSSSSGDQSAGTSSESSSSSAEQSSTDTSSETSAASDGSSLTKPFGSTFTWDDKLAVTVSKPTPYKPSGTAATGDKFKTFAKMTVVLKNGTDKVYDASGFTTSATSGDQEAESVYDSGGGIDSPSAKILPGKSLTFNIAYGYTPGQDFTLTVNSYDDFNRADGIYNTKL